MSLFFDYDLPAELIAQHPAAQRDDARLLLLRRASRTIEHRTFRDLPSLLMPNDLLVLNDTKVLPARLVGHRENTGGKWEALFLRAHADGTWELLSQTRGYPHEGELFRTETGLRLKLAGRTEDRHWLMRPEVQGRAEDLLAIHGRIPLPPYIRHGRADEADQERYQTVFAQALGSVAAPTAGLHFTPELLQRLREAGVQTATVTLHVGLGTFEPVKVENPTEHKIHAEWCEVPESTVAAIQRAKASGNRVLAVGTTTTRTLETAATDNGLSPFRGESSLFIHPPFEFRVVDSLLTNFHLPRTTLLLLVQAMCGGDFLKQAYEEAIAHRYRFFSYGDAMLVL